MTAIYNEIDEYAARWIGNLIAADHVAPGTVDTRSIAELTAEDVRHATQAHFFAGIAVWSAALRAAGWPDGAPIWTGSCPCQPFSQAGRGGGVTDDRHLWPEWFRLIRECRPPVIVGEQVASPAGLAWLDVVLADLEGAGYACAAIDFCAASVGAPHQRQRLYFVAVAAGYRLADNRHEGRQQIGEDAQGSAGRSKAKGLEQRPLYGGAKHMGASAMALADKPHPLHGNQPRGWRLVQPAPHATSGFWGAADWIPCADGKARPVEPGTFPLAHGATARVGRLRAYGNAIVRPQAQAFIEAVIEMLTATDEPAARLTAGGAL